MNDTNIAAEALARAGQGDDDPQVRVAVGLPCGPEEFEPLKERPRELP